MDEASIVDGFQGRARRDDLAGEQLHVGVIERMAGTLALRYGEVFRLPGADCEVVRPGGTRWIRAVGIATRRNAGGSRPRAEQVIERAILLHQHDDTVNRR